MPLPAPGKTVWPPKSVEAAYKRYGCNAAWYGGDPEALSALYEGQQSWSPGSGDTKFRVSQFRGGLVGAVSRFFWGTPPPAGELKAKLHLPIASDIATMSADLLFSEPPKLTGESSEVTERLAELSDLGDLQSRLIEGAEVCAALGDVFLVVMWDQGMRDFPWIRVVHGDAVVPEWRGDMLMAATIWTVVLDEEDGHVWRHLERHERGVVEHGLYYGDSRTLGRLMDLTDQDATKDFTPVVDTGIDRLLVEHVPNMRPNRLDRGSMLGRSDYSPGSLQLMDELDAVWSSLSREFRLAKARAVVSVDALRPLGPGQGSTVDADREFYSTLNIDPTKNPSVVDLLQPLIRVDEHIAGARALTEQIVRSCGYSLHSFGEGGQDGAAAATATEIQQRERLSYLTRGKKTLHWGRLASSLETLLMVDNIVFKSKVSPERPQVEFGDVVAESDAVTASTLNLLNQAESASIQERVKRLHPEWDETAVLEESDRIKQEKGLSPVPDPLELVHSVPGKPVDTPNDQPVDGPVSQRPALRGQAAR